MLENPSSEQSDAVDAMWKKYSWLKSESTMAFEEKHPDVVPKKMVENIHDWEEYACRELGIR